MSRFRKTEFAVIVAVSSLIFASPAWAATYFVAPNGSDQNPGTAAQPLKTLQHASDIAGPGDTVEVTPGDYVGFVRGWDGPQNGLPNQPVTFHAQSGARITTRNPRTPDGINLEGASYIIIDGFEVFGMPRAGIRSVVNNHVTIRNNFSHQNTKWGIITGFSDDLLIENNITSYTEGEHGIYIGNSSRRIVLRRNVSHHNHGCGIHMNGDIETQNTGSDDGIMHEVIVENNTIYENGLNGGGGSAINGDGVQDSIIRNNLLYNNHASGISLYQIDGGEPAKRNLVVNNTVLVAADGRWALNIKNGSTNNRVFNNILFSAHSFRGAISLDTESRPGFESDYNVTEDRFTPDDDATIMTLAQWRAATGQDVHSSTIGTPAEALPNIGQGDYIPVAPSLALDHGRLDIAPSIDLRGASRPQGAGVDIGAFEFGSTGGGGGGGDGGGAGGGGGGTDGGGGNTGGLNAPSDLTATYDLSTNDVVVQWTDNSTENGFQVERSTNNRRFRRAGRVGTDVTGFSERVKPKRKAAVRFYRVFAYTGTKRKMVRSPLSEVVSVTIPAKPPRLRR